MTRLPLLVRLLLAPVDPEVREYLTGDIEETWDRARLERGPLRAALAASMEAVTAVVTHPRRRLGRPRGEVMRTLIQDIRYGVRVVRRSPGYAAVVALTLSLAIGANTVIFSFANVLLLRPLPIRDQDRVAWIFTVDPEHGNDRGAVSAADLLDYRASVEGFQSLAATMPGSYTMTGRGDAVSVTASRATTNLIDTWGLRLVIGRPFADGDDRPGAAPVVVLSHRFWARQFHEDPSIVGQALVLNGRPHTIIGVLAPDIEIGNLSRIDVWTPLVLDPSTPRDRRALRVSGRLAPGVSFDQVAASVRDVSRRLERDHPRTNAGWQARLAPTREALVNRDSWLVFSLLMLVVGLVLLTACANIANLVLGRATVRRRELAVRAALGASRIRMIRQLLTESVLLGGLGGVGGLATAWAGLKVIKWASYEPFFALIDIDRNVLAFTAGLSVLTPIVFSLLPAVQASKADVSEALKDTASRAAGGASGRRSRAALVVAQLALAMVLLIASGLFVRTLIAIQRAPLGFDAEHLVALKLEAPEWRYRSDGSVVDYFEALDARLTSLPGVRFVGATDRLPVLGPEPMAAIDVAGRAEAKPADRVFAVLSAVTPGFFAAAGVPLTAGRGFGEHDDAAAMRVAIVNAEMARRYWGGSARALGAELTIQGEGADRMRIVGVVADVKRADLVGSNPEVYLPVRQHPRRALSVFVRAADAGSALAPIRAAVRALDADVPIQELRTFRDAIDEDQSSSRVLVSLFVAFAVLALVLAASGLYSVVSYFVSQRIQEIGIRVALGAAPEDIRRLVLRQTTWLVAIGVALGLAGGAAIARASASVLYQVTPSDPTTYLAVAAILIAVAFAAACAPVRRATRVDPLTAIRSA